MNKKNQILAKTTSFGSFDRGHSPSRMDLTREGGMLNWIVLNVALPLNAIAELIKTLISTKNVAIGKAEKTGLSFPELVICAPDFK
jgi:hypothetical protein